MRHLDVKCVKMIVFIKCKLEQVSVLIFNIIVKCMNSK